MRYGSLTMEEAFEMKEPAEKEKIILGRKVHAIGWSLFFIWIGVSMIGNFESSLTLLGIGLILLGGQAGRKYFSLEVETFWVIVGFLFLFGGLWDIFGLNVPFGAAILILIGVLGLFKTLRRQGNDKAENEDTIE